MTKTKKAILSIVLCFLMVILLCCVLSANTPVKANAGGVCSIVLANNDGTPVYENHNVNSQDDLDDAYYGIRNVYYEKCNPQSDYAITLELYNDATLDLNDFTFGSPFIIKLNGHTLTLNYSLSWRLQGGLQIYGDGGKIKTNYSQSGAFACDALTTGVVVKDTTFENFDCGRFGIFYVEGSNYLGTHPDVLIEGCTFNNCSSTSYGGVLYTYLANAVTFKKCSFNNCKSDCGGVVYAEDSYGTVSFYGCTVKDCTADYGGAIYIDDTSMPNGEEDHNDAEYYVFIQGTTFHSCKAYDGGAVYLDVDYGTVHGNHTDWDSERAYFINCQAERYGGAICTNGYHCYVADCAFQGCKAKYGNSTYHFGSESMDMWCSYTDSINGTGTFMSGGSAWIICVVGGVALITAGVFIALYIREKKKIKVKE